MKPALSVALAVLLSGCAVTPSITYRSWSDRPRKDSWVPYQLTDTTLVIGVAGPAAPTGTPAGGTPTASASGDAKKKETPAASDAAPGSDKASTHAAAALPDALVQPVPRSELYPITLTPVTLDCFPEGCTGQAIAAAAVPVPYETAPDDGGATLGIEPGHSWMVYTRIAPTYYDNSLRLHTLEFAVEDKRQETIDTVGALALGVAKLSTKATRDITTPGAAPAAGKTLRLPVIIDLADAKRAQTSDVPLPYNPGWKYRVRFMDDPRDAGFLQWADRGQVHGAVLTSLCRPLRITISNSETSLVMGVTVADPDYLLTTPLPPTGTITFGTLCGANVAMGKSVTTPTNALVTSFFSDVMAVRAVSATPTPTPGKSK